MTGTALAAISGFSSLTIYDVYNGNSAAAAATIAGGVTFPVPTGFYSSGPISVSGGISMTAGQALTLAAGQAQEVNNTASGSGGVTFAGGSGVSYTGSATAASSLSISTVGSGNTITLGSATAGTSSPLTVTLTAPGAITVAGNVTTDGGPFTATGQGITLSGSVAAGSSATLSGGASTIAVNGALSTTAGAINISGTGDISVTAPITATAGNVTLDDHTGSGVGITVTGTTIRARNNASDVTTNGTVNNTGNVILTGATVTAGTGRTVTLSGGPGGPSETVMGTVFSTFGGSVLSGATVNLLVNGASDGSVTANGSGVYDFTVPNGTIPASGAEVLVFLSSGATGNSLLDGATGSISALDIYGGYLHIISGGGTLSSMASGLAKALGGNSGTNFLFTISGGTTLNLASGASLEIDASGPSLALNQAISTTANAVLNSTGTVTQSQPITAGGLDLLGTGGAYTLTTGTNAIATLAANTGSATVDTTGTLTIAPVAGTSGFTATGGASLTAGSIVLAANAAVVVPGTSGLSLTAGTGGSITQTSGATVTLTGAGTVTLDANTIALNGAAGSINSTSPGSGIVNLVPLTAGTTIGIGAAGIGTLAISQTTLNAIGSSPVLDVGLSGAQTGLVTLAGPISFSAATQIYGNGTGGQIDLGGAITSSGQPLTFNGSTVLTGNTIITTTGGSNPAGAAVTFASTLGGASAYLDNLGITAGSGGNVTFAAATGTRLGAVTISSANAVAMDGAFSAAALTIAGASGAPGAATLTAASNINTAGATSATLPTTGGAVAIATSGAVTISGAINTNGGVNSTSNVGGNGGPVTINAGGAVQLGSTLNPATTSAIFTGGFNAGSGQTAGSGGAISVTGTSINLFANAESNGGSATAAGAVGTGGTAGAIALTTTSGDLTGSSTAFPSAAVEVIANGGGTTATVIGNGSGGTVTINTAGNVTITGNVAAVGDNGGALTISAGGAVQIGSLLNPTATAAISASGFTAGSGQTAGSGGNISVSGTSISLFSGANSEGGAATAAGAVGAGGTAGTITLTTTAGDLTLSSTAFPTTPVYVTALGGASGTVNGGSGNTVMINTAGNVTITGDINTVGGVAGGSGMGGNGGAVTIAAGGSVTIGAGETLVTHDNKNPLGGNTVSIVSRGAITATSTSAPGNGAPVSVSGTTIDLPFGISSTGGEAADALTSSNGSIGWTSNAITGWLGPSTANGGSGGAITITGSGAVLIGNPAGSPSTSTGNVIGLFSFGGESTGGSGGNAGAVSVTGATVALAKINALGGDTLAATAGGNGANITVTALSAVPGAITLYGNSDQPAVVTATPNSTLTTRGGFIDVPALGNSGAPAILNGQAGNLTLQVPSGGSIVLATSTTNTTTTGTTTTGTTTSGSNVITGVTSTAGFQTEEWISGPGIPAGTAIAAISGSTITINQPASASSSGITLTALPVPNGVNAGSTVRLSVVGGFNAGTSTPLGGTMTITGPIEGATANAESLQLTAADGTVTLSGSVGASQALNSLVFGAGLNTSVPSGGSGGAITLLGPVTAATQIVTLSNSGSVTFNGLVTTPLFTMIAGSTSLELLGGAAFTGPVTFSGGAMTLAGDIVFTGASVNPNFSGPITLAGATTIDSSAVIGNVTVSSVNTGADSAQSLTIDASGVITVAADVSTNGGAFSATGQGITLNGAVSAGSGVTLAGGAGTIAVNGALSTTAGGITISGTGNISVNAPITATGGNVAIDDHTGSGVGITVNDTTIRARNTASDATTNGTVNNTGNVTLTGAIVTAGTGRTVMLSGAPGGVTETVMGTVFSTLGGSVLSDATVNLLVNGTSEGSVTANGSGVYDFTLPNGTIPSSGAGVLVYLSGGTANGNSFYDGATGSISALDIYGDYVRIVSGGSTLSSMVSGLAAAAGAASNPNLLFTVGGGSTLSLASGANLKIAASASSLNLDRAITAAGATVVLNGAGAVSQTQPITAGSLALLGGGSFTLTNGANSVTTLAANAASVNVTDGAGLTVGTVAGAAGVNASGSVTLATAGSLTLAQGVTGSGAGDAVTLADGTSFTNQDGSGAIVANGGNWLVWSQTPAADTLDGLAFGFKQYAATYGVTAPAQSSGNGVLYTLAPTVTASLTGTVTKTYDATEAATLTAANYALAGVEAGDIVTINHPAAGTYGTANAGTGLSVSVSGVAITGATSGSATVYGYQLANPVVTGNVGVINPAALTVTAIANTKTYDGTTSAAARPMVTGLVGGDTTSSLGETYASRNAGTGLTLTPSATIDDGNGGHNYTLTLVASTAGVINPAVLTVTAVANTKTYDGTTSAAATPTVAGLVRGDTTSGLGETYASPNAGTGLTLTPATTTINDGNGGHNYTLMLVANTAGVINPEALTVTAVENTKTYDGTTSAAATPTVTGLVGGDTVSGSGETYASANAGSGLTLTPAATINDGNGGNNYAVTLVANTTGVINPATLTYVANPASIAVGAALPAFGGSVTGVVNGETLTTATTGTLSFATTATPASPAGLYPITGSGLAANHGNYIFVQAAGNATALNIGLAEFVSGSVYSDFRDHAAARRDGRAAGERHQ